MLARAVIVHLPCILVLLILIVDEVIAGSCTMINGVMPAAGSCSGPIGRSMLMLQNVQSVNQGCGVNQVPYSVDGDSTQPMCGNCIPGSYGADDLTKMCAINEYCSDNATCINIANQPLYGASCPYEIGGDTSQGFCGTGLRCYQHSCLPCIDGMIDYSDGKFCVQNRWTYNQWSNTFNSPTPTLLVTMIGLVLCYALIQILLELFIQIIKCIKKRRALKKNDDGNLKLLDEKAEEDGENDEEEEEEEEEEDEDDDEEEFEDEPEVEPPKRKLPPVTNRTPSPAPRPPPSSPKAFSLIPQAYYQNLQHRSPSPPSRQLPQTPISNNSTSPRNQVRAKSPLSSSSRNLNDNRY